MTPADAQVSRDYDGLRESVVRVLEGRLRSRRITFDPSDLEDFYNEAWHALYLKLREGEAVESPGGFLVQVAWFRAIDEFRRRHPEEHDDEADPAAVATDDDVDGRLDANQVLRAFTQGIRGALDEREASAAVLCYLHGMSRPEAAEALGIGESRMQKLMDGVSKKLGPVIQALREGSWCETRDSLVKAYALGLLDPDGDRYALAVGHLEDCGACRRRVLALRGLASVAPPLALPWAALQYGSGGAAAAAGGHAATPLPRGPRGPLRHVLRARRSGRLLASSAAGATAVVVTAAVVFASGGGQQARQSTGVASAGAATAAPAAPTPAAAPPAARKAARARQRARERRAQAQRRAAATRRAREAAAVTTTPAPAVTAPATLAPAATAAPAAAPTVVPAPVDTPAAAPTRAPTAAPKPPPTNDAAQEFDFEP